LFQADSVEITVLVENWVDMLLPDMSIGDHCVSRSGLIEHFDPEEQPPQAENGISFLVRATAGRRSTTILFDMGLTPEVLRHNMRALRQDPASVDHLVLSHGHPDHYGGIYGCLDLFERPVPVATHSDAFLPRYAVMGDGRTSGFYNSRFREEDVEAHGGRLVLTRDSLELGSGVLTTGEIPRVNDFEGTPTPATMRAPGLYQVQGNGERVVDQVTDEVALLIDVRGVGIVALTGCAHAGVVNTLHRAKDLLGDRRVAAIAGGFHLGFPTTPSSNIERTVSALRDLDVGLVMPMHCSGLGTHSAMSREFDGRYVQPAVGTTIHIGS
jgi:7,8-dihydropterin-6-yl-methyl-4-(beta-D-ribofuranosyl)aminobenzene 5'-phosphate synthase